MSFLNLGKQDGYGRQRRIEHRGRHLRASRTGGVALRAQAKAAGLTFTGNTARGARVSMTPARNTQVALQNGRLILRGRYGRGPVRLNLSKSGFSLSSRNALGSFNWTNPLRSSAKIAGLQFRGRTAAYLQFAYAVASLFVALVLAAVVLAIRVAQVLLVLFGFLVRGCAAIPVWIADRRRRRQADRLSALADTFEQQPHESDGWTPDHCKAAALLIVGAWGRAQSAAVLAHAYADGLEAGDPNYELAAASKALREIPITLDALRQRTESGVEGDLLLLAIAARRLNEALPPDSLIQILFEIDERLLEDGPRTRLQNQMLEVFADFAQIRLALQTEEPQVSTAAAPGADPVTPDGMDINTVDFDALQTIPGIGPERAEAILTMRPLQNIDQITELNGIGPKRLQAIREYGVVCGGVKD